MHCEQGREQILLTTLEKPRSNNRFNSTDLTREKVYVELVLPLPDECVSSQLRPQSPVGPEVQGLIIPGLPCRLDYDPVAACLGLRSSGDGVWVLEGPRSNCPPRALFGCACEHEYS